MKNIRISSLLLMLVLFLMGTVNAQQALISAKEASKLSKSDDVVIVSTRKVADYQKVHAQGAVHIDLAELYTASPVRAMLKAPGEIAEVLGQAGIGNQMQILIYDDGSEKYAGRLYWILDYLGAPNAMIIDGGMKEWRRSRLPVTKNPTNIKPATFTTQVDPSKIATLSQVKAALGNSKYVVVDVRSLEEYNGSAETALRKGHIPGAVNIPHTSVLNPEGTMRTVAELEKLFQENGVSSNKQVILYCETSTRAGIVYVALSKLLKYPNVRVFDGAYVQWQSDSANQVDAD